MAQFGQMEVAAHHNELRRSVAVTSADGAVNNIAWRNVMYGQAQVQQLIQAQIAEFVAPAEIVVRISVPESGAWGEVTTEMEFESFGALEAKLAEWMARPTSAAYIEGVNPLISPGGHTELWDIHH